MECTDIFWHTFYKAAGVTLGCLLPLILGLGTMMLTLFQLEHRHQEAMQEARMREYHVQDSHYRVIQGGHG
jgi:hypothetical protein